MSAFARSGIHWQWDGVETAHRKTIELDPSYPLGHRMLGVLLSHSGQHSEAQAQSPHS